MSFTRQLIDRMEPWNPGGVGESPPVNLTATVSSRLFVAANLVQFVNTIREVEATIEGTTTATAVSLQQKKQLKATAKGVTTTSGNLLLHGSVSLGATITSTSKASGSLATSVAGFLYPSIFNEDVTALPRVNATTEAALFERHEALRLVNQVNYSRKAYKYETGGTAPQFYGYHSTGAKGPTGIGYAGAKESERIVFRLFSGVVPFYRVPNSTPRVRVFMTESGENEGAGVKGETLRGLASSSGLPEKMLEVPMPISAELSSGFDSFTATLTSTTELTGIQNNARIVFPGARITGPKLTGGEATIVSVNGNTAKITPAAEATGGPSTYTIYKTIWSEGGDKHLAIWCPVTNEYWEFWEFGVWHQELWKSATSYVLHNAREDPTDGKLYECILATSGTTEPHSDASHWKVMACKNGDYRCAYGGYTNEAETWNGIFEHEWGARASGLAAMGGHIGYRDLIKVLRGETIEHAMGCTAISTKKPPILPSKRKGDEIGITQAFPTLTGTIVAGLGEIEKLSSTEWISEGAQISGAKLKAETYVGTISGSTCKLVNEKGEALSAESAGSTTITIANPAAAELGHKDSVVEGAWFAYPAAQTATVAGLVRATEPLLYEVYEAIRIYGLFVIDSSSHNISIAFDDPRALGSPYCEQEINPWNGYTGPSPTKAKIEEYVKVPSSWNIAEVKGLKENLEGSGNVLQKLPKLETLEQLAPRLS